MKVLQSLVVVFSVGLVFGGLLLHLQTVAMRPVVRLCCIQLPKISKLLAKETPQQVPWGVDKMQSHNIDPEDAKWHSLLPYM